MENGRSICGITNGSVSIYDDPIVNLNVEGDCDDEDQKFWEQ